MLDLGMHIRDRRALFAEIARVLRPNGLMVMHEQTGPLPSAMRPVMRAAPYITPSLPRLIRSVEGAEMRVLTWRDTTNVVLDYFLRKRDLVLDASKPLAGRTGVLIARRLS